MHHSTDRITHTTAFVTPAVEDWLEREILQVLCTNQKEDDQCALCISANIPEMETTVQRMGIKAFWKLQPVVTCRTRAVCYVSRQVD